MIDNTYGNMNLSDKYFEFLLSYGIEIHKNFDNDHEYTILAYCFINGNFNRSSCLYRYDNEIFKFIDFEGDSVSHCIILSIGSNLEDNNRGETSKKIKFSIGKGADIDVENKNGDAAYTSAIIII